MTSGLVLRKGLRGLIRTTGAGDNPPSGQRLLVPKSDGWYDRDAAGVEIKVGPGGSYTDPEAPPSYVGARANPFDAATSWYNLTNTSMSNIRGLLAKSQTQRVRLAFVGHSIIAGSYTSEIGKYDIASQTRRFLSGEGTNVNGTGWVFISSNPGSNPALARDARWTSITGWTLSASQYYFYASTTTNGAAAIFQSDYPGTIIEVATYNNTGPISIYVDDVLKDTYTGPGGALAVVIRSITGLDNTKHKVEIRTTSTTASILMAVQVRDSKGMEVTNAGNGGATLNSWATGDMSTLRQATENTVNPDIVVISLDGNELWSGVTAADYKTAYNEFIDYWAAQGAKCMMMTAPNLDNGVVSQAQREAYLSAQYDIADTYDLPLLDTTNLFVNYATANTLGWMGDFAHPNDIGHAVIARTFAQEILKTQPYDTRVDNEQLLGAEYVVGNPVLPTKGLLLFTRLRGRRMLAIVGPSGQDTRLQPLLASNRVSMVTAQDNSATPLYMNTAAWNIAGAALVALASTNFYTSMERFRMTTSAVANNGVSLRPARALWFLSSTANMGGFWMVARFGLQTTAANTRGFIGMSSTTAAFSASVNPSTLFNQFGIGWDTGMTNMRFMTNDGSGVSTMVDLGADYPTAASPATYFYEVSLFCPSGGGQKVDYSIQRLNDGKVFQSSYAGADMPAVGVMLMPHVELGTGSQTVAQSIDVQQVYMERDN